MNVLLYLIAIQYCGELPLFRARMERENILRPKETMPEKPPSVRNNRFSDAEIVCELLQLEIDMSNQWERCYPTYDESSHFWPAYLLIKERHEAVERIALGESI